MMCGNNTMLTMRELTNCTINFNNGFGWVISGIIILLIWSLCYSIYINHIKLKDPWIYCDVYKDKNCCHVDGYLCEVDTCGILKEYREENKNV